MRRTLTAVAAALTAGAFTLAIMFGTPAPKSESADSAVSVSAVK